MRVGSRGVVPLVLLSVNCVISLYWAFSDFARDAWGVGDTFEWLVTLLVSGGSLTWLVVHRSRLRSYEERTDRMVSAMSDEGNILWEATLDGVVSYVGLEVERVLGFRPSDIVGRHMDAVIAPRERARAMELFKTSWRAGHGWQDEYFMMCAKDGREVPMFGTAVAHIGARGEVKGFTGWLRRTGTDSADRRECERIKARVTDVLDGRLIQMVFQPIVDAEFGRVVGAEALARFPHDPSVPVNQWFDDAALCGLGVELEVLALEEGLADAHLLPFEGYLSLNVSPATLLTGRLPGLIEDSGWDPCRLVVEITEHVGVDDYVAVSDALAPLRRLGVRLAIDDAGSGYASFQHILRLSPDFIKLDRVLVGGIDRERATRALLAAVATFAAEIGARVIAEGVETSDELHSCVSLGVAYAQGYLFARPAPAGPLWCSNVGRTLAVAGTV